MSEEPEQPRFDLVCTKCKEVLMVRVQEDTIKLVQAGYCNRKKCEGKLEWKKV